VIKINIFSKLASLSIRTLRYYDEIDLLKPYYVDEITNYRYYEPSQLTRANKIVQLKSLGFSLKDIKYILDESDLQALQFYFSLRKKEIEQELENINSQSQLLEKISENLNYREDNSFMSYNVIEKVIPKRKVISLKKVIPTYYDEGLLWQELAAEINKQNVKMASEPCALAVFHDCEYKEKDVCVEVQLSVEGDYQNNGDIVFFETDQLKVASATFNGSYEQEPQVIEAIAYWIENNKYEIVGPMLNIYHVSPNEEKDPEKWITEACFVVAEK